MAGCRYHNAEDLLGTSRVITTNRGVVSYDGDFYPFGGERPYTDTCPQSYKFEGKERDVETGNDDFGARSYSNRFGRWLSADWSNVPAPVPYANLTNPQTLNLYAMVADDPESFADLDGHGSVIDTIIRLAGGSRSNPAPALKNLAIGAAKGLVNQVIGFANTVRGTDRPIQSENGPRQSADAIPELKISNRGEAMGAIAAPVLVGAVIGGVAGGSGGAAATSETTSEILQGAANRAAATVGEGSGAAYGTAVHSEFTSEIEALGNPNLSSEVSYLKGEVVAYGTKGSIRADAVEGPLNSPNTVYDLKTGNASLTPARTQQIQSNLPGGSNVPVKEIKPQ